MRLSVLALLLALCVQSGCILVLDGAALTVVNATSYDALEVSLEPIGGAFGETSAYSEPLPSGGSETLVVNTGGYTLLLIDTAGYGCNLRDFFFTSQDTDTFSIYDQDLLYCATEDYGGPLEPIF